MSKESKFIPMPEAQTLRLETTAQLPFNLDESIGLNVGRLQTLCQISGFRHLKIENNKKPLTSKAAPMIVGVNQKGEALAGKAGVDTVPNSIHSIKKIDNQKIGYKNSIWNNLTITLNTEEMRERMLLDEKDTRQVEYWVKDINKSLTQGIVRAGVNNLMFNNLDLIEIFMTTVIARLNLASLKSPETALGHFAAQVAAITTIRGILAGFENFQEGTGSRWTALIGPEIDRTVILLALANTQELAKKL